jgi:predicted lipid-binding transport protein (Tim44 family)
MEERYPYLRFIIDAAQVIAGAVAVIVLLGGTFSSCHRGGFGGFFSFLIALAIAAVVYIVVMAKIEFLRALLDIESNTRQSTAQRQASTSGPSA